MEKYDIIVRNRHTLEKLGTLPQLNADSSRNCVMKLIGNQLFVGLQSGLFGIYIMPW